MTAYQDKKARTKRERLMRALFDTYTQLRVAGDDRLREAFSETFSGYAGHSDVLVRGRDEWLNMTRFDTGSLRFEPLDLSLQDISEIVVVITAVFRLHLSTSDPILCRETLIFRLEGEDWKIVHVAVSSPRRSGQQDEGSPLESLSKRNRKLEALVEMRTRELEEANLRLEVLSGFDTLTGLANRGCFERLLAQEWNRGRRTGDSLAVILVDIDRFKHFNDCYGHLAGDHCLQLLGQALVRRARRAGDLVARYGGEEFVVLLPGVDKQGALNVARHMQHEIWSLELPHAETVAGIVTASFGVASGVPSGQGIAEDLVRQALSALDGAKEAGRNCVKAAEEE